MPIQVYNGIAAAAGALKGELVDRVGTLTTAGSSFTVADPTNGDSNVRLTLNSATCALRLPGSPGSVRFTAASGKRTYAAASITGDLDVRVQFTPSNTFVTSQHIVLKDTNVSGGRGWLLQLGTSGNTSFTWSVNGTSVQTVSSSGPLAFVVGQTVWLRATLNTATGQATLYSSRDGVNWTQLNQLNGTAGAIFDNSTRDYQIGQSGTASAQFQGEISYVDIRSGIGGTTMLPTDPNSWASTGSNTLYAAVAAPSVGSRLKLALQQDATGGRLVYWPPNIFWPGTQPPKLSTAPGAVDYFELDWVDGVAWYGRPLTQDAYATQSRVDIQKFTASGTWNKPYWATQVEFDGQGAGGGGGSGRRGAAGTVRQGGGGASGGNRNRQIFDAADLTQTVAVTVGSGGTGGAAQPTDSTDGIAGVNGGTTSFGSYTKAAGGTAGGGGGSGAGGVGGLPTPGQMAGGNGSNCGATGVPVNAAVLNAAAPGGAAGGGVDASNVGYAGGTAYSTSDNPNYNAFAGGATGAAGTAGTTQVDRTPANSVLPGVGGPGGGGGTGGPGGAGAAGSKYGAGGGGGGASTNGSASGAGGDGAAGIAWVISRG